MNLHQFGMGGGMVFSSVQLKSHTSILMDKLQNDGFTCQTHNDFCFNVILVPNKVVNIAYMGIGYSLTIEAINFKKIYDTYPKLVAALRQYERS